MSACFECQYCGQQFSYAESAEQHCADKREREAIVRFLRSCAADLHQLERDKELADMIEAGEHLK